MSMKLAYSYTIAIGVTSATAARVTPEGVHAVRIAASGPCYITIDSSPTATVATSTLINSGARGEDFIISPGDQIAVIGDAASGNLNVTELTR